MNVNILKEVVLRRSSWGMNPHISGFIGYNLLAYGMYKYISGPTKNNFRRKYTVEPGSSALGYLTAHLFPTSFWDMTISAALMFSVGNKHILKYGALHFWKIAALGAVGASTMAMTYDKSEYSGALGSAFSVTFYNAIKNPGWFMYGKYFTAALLFGYCVYYNDHIAGGSLISAYLAFLFAL